MRGLFGLLIVGSLFAIGTVLVGGVSDAYDIGNVAVLTGGNALLAGFAVLGGSVAALLSWVEAAVATDGGVVVRTAFRPGLVAVALVLFIVAAFIVFGAGSADTVDDLKAGECFNEPSTPDVATVDTVPCSELHGYEVVGLRTLKGSGAFPGDSAVGQAAAELCLPLFESYVGVAYQDSALDIATLSPTASSWEAGDRGVTCAVYRLDGGLLQNSVRGLGLKSGVHLA